MNYEWPSAADDRDRVESLYGESSHETAEPGDERRLYGEPCHEVEPKYDEQTLYGEPQHETRDTAELPDLELLFARLRAESVTGPTVVPSGSDSSTATPTER